MAACLKPSLLLLALLLPAAAQQCDLATLFAHLSEIQDTCCMEEECSSGYPGAEDACSRGCGEIFEPFWDSAIPLLPLALPVHVCPG